MSEARAALKEWLLGQVGRPYVFGNKGALHAQPDGQLVPCYDCSGLVTCGLLHIGGPDWRLTHGSARLFEVLQPTDTPLPLDLCFYGPPGGISHVMVLWDDGRVLGASGGNYSTLDVETACRIGARVHFKPRVGYRPDFVAYRRFPFPEESRNA